MNMPSSHRKFGDLLEEGLKRVHIARRKPIGYILDEFGYVLRPDDSSKGRYALGHWYYKKRIPASMDDVAKLAELIVTNSDVERDWLKRFLESAGYPEVEKLCNTCFPSATGDIPSSAPNVADRLQVENNTNRTSLNDKSSTRSVSLWNLFVYGIPTILGIVALLFFIQRQKATSSINVILTATQFIQPIIPAMPEVQVTETVTPVEEPTIPPLTSTPDFALFDGRCPAVSSTSVFEYTLPQSFKDFLNKGGSFVALQSGFNLLVQEKIDVKDGHIVGIDLTGDDVPEVIVDAILKDGTIWQILGCNSGQYESLVDLNEPNDRYLRFTVDLNGNKLPEIIGYHQTRLESTELFEIFIQQWNGHQIVDLIDDARFEDVGKRTPVDIFDWQRKVANATVETRDVNRDGLYEVIVTGGLITPVPNCETRFERQFSEVWAWNGKSFQFSDRVYMPPIYRFQRSADGDIAFALKKFDVALEAYRDVLFDADLFRRDQYLSHLEYCKGIGPEIENALVDNEPEQLNAYARWRILLINTIEGSTDAMQVVYKTLQDKFPEGKAGHSYAVIATAFWDEYQASQNVSTACKAANSSASEQKLYPSHMAENICFIP